MSLSCMKVSAHRPDSKPRDITYCRNTMAIRCIHEGFMSAAQNILPEHTGCEYSEVVSSSVHDILYFASVAECLAVSGIGYWLNQICDDIFWTSRGKLNSGRATSVLFGKNWRERTDTLHISSCFEKAKAELTCSQWRSVFLYALT